MASNLLDTTYRACMVGSYGDFVSGVIAGQKEPFAFLDIGANQGLYSLLAVRNPNCAAVYAVEPNPKAFIILVENVSLNGAEGRVRPIAGAVAAEGLHSFSVPPGHSGAASMFADFGGTRFEAPGVEADALKALFAESMGRRILAKIDVEGAEAVALERLDALGLMEPIDAVVIEVSARVRGEAYARSLPPLMEALGFALRSRTPGSGDHDALYVRCRAAAAALPESPAEMPVSTAA